MITRKWRRDKDGNEVLLDEKGEVMAIRVPLALMDGLDPMQRAVARDAGEGEPSLIRHSPGPLARSAEADARVAEAAREYEAELTTRWSQGNRPAQGTTAEPGRTPDGLAAAYNQYHHALTNAWRGGKAA